MCFKVIRSLIRTKKSKPGSPAELVRLAELSHRETSPTSHSQLEARDQEPVRSDEPQKLGDINSNALQGYRLPDHDIDCRAAAEDTPDQTSSEWRTTAWNSAKVALRLIKESADVFPPLKAVAGGLCELINNFEQTGSNRDSIRSVTQRILNLNESITKRGIQDLDETKRRKRLESTLTEIATQLDGILEGNVAKRFVNNVEDGQVIAGLVDDIRDALTEYQISLQQDIYDMNRQHIASDHRSTLDKLPRAKYAGHRSGKRQPCMKGTRVELLHEIEEWSIFGTALPIYWLNGVAGTGKTTISQSLAERLFADDRLGASFFFSRDYVDRSNIELVFPTIAFQLAYKIPEFRALLVDIINHHPDVGEMSLAEQLKYLLIQPLRSLSGTPVSTNPPLVIIIDALDECDDTEPESKFLSLLSEHISDIPFVKFFITSRPEYSIRSIFNKPLKHHTRTLVLQDFDRTTVDRDIGIYLRTRLSAVAARSDVSIVAPWPSSEDVDIIVQQCAGLFIYGSTIAKFVGSLHADPRVRLQLITSIPRDRSVHQVVSEIGPLYMQILTHGFSEVHLTESHFEQVRLVVACILFAFNPLPLTSVAMLLNIVPGDVVRILRPLHSVLLVPDDISKPARRFHKSFPDFLTDPNQCKNDNFHLNKSIYHGKITIHCLDLIKKIKKNTCKIPRYAMNIDVGDLPARRMECIGGATEYACRFWTDHLSFASRTGEDANLIVKSLKGFFENQVLLWIEVLSITECLDVAVYSIRRVQRWLADATILDTELQDLIYDSQRFILQSFDVLRQSVPHMYHSALPFLPTSSQLRKRYQHEISNEVKIVTGIDVSWDACTRRILTTGRPTCIRFSQNGNVIATNSGSAIEIFDAITGVRRATLKDHGDDVKSIMFSPDNALLISGSKDRTIKVWDIQTGGLVRTLEGHMDDVLSVSISPDGARIASGSGDHTVHIWDVCSGECTAVFEGHSEGVNLVCWSGCTKVLSASNTIKLWDVSAKTPLKLDALEHAGSRRVAFSSDGTKIALGDLSTSIYIYDIQTGITKTVETGYNVCSVCFSPNGSQILCESFTHLYIRDISSDNPSSITVGHARKNYAHPSFSADGLSIASADDETVKISQHWNNQTVHCHSTAVGLVGFSNDGKLAVSASFDDTAKVWDVAAGACLHTIHGDCSGYVSITVSPNSSLVAWMDDRGSYGMVIWDVRTDQLVHRMEGHNNHVWLIEFSPEGNQLVSISEVDIIVWDVETGTTMAVLKSNFSAIDWIRFSDDRTIVLRVGSVMKRLQLCLVSTSSPSSNDHATALDLATGVAAAESSSAVSTPPPIAAASPSSDTGIKPVPIPFDLVQISEDASISPFSSLIQYRFENGWILDENERRVCYVPEVGAFACYGQKVIIGTLTGNFMIMDFSNTNSSIR